MSNWFDDLATRVSEGAQLSREDALTILRSPDAELITLVAAGARLRRQTFGDTVKVNYLVNLKSGLCPEDCTYCSQRLGSTSPILKYTWLSQPEAVAQAAAGINAGASRICLVASGKGPSSRDTNRVADIVTELKTEHPETEICVCLGILKPGQADTLKDAGADAYNHNLNTAESRYADICTTHTFEDRTRTVHLAQTAGLSACSGLIVGMGETDEELVDAVFALRDLHSESIPVNFLLPLEGTPLEDTWLLTPTQCIRILALIRFACPTTEVRMGAGREAHLRTLQPLGLHLANSLFLGDYLTSEGQDATIDLEMITDAGLRILGSEHPDTPQPTPTLRQRGAGTTAPPNA